MDEFLSLILKFLGTHKIISCNASGFRVKLEILCGFLQPLRQGIAIHPRRHWRPPISFCPNTALLLTLSSILAKSMNRKNFSGEPGLNNYCFSELLIHTRAAFLIFEKDSKASVTIVSIKSFTVGIESTIPEAGDGLTPCRIS